MNLPSEAIEIIILVCVIGVGMYFVSFITKGSRNFRSSRNRRARKQDQPFDL